MKNLFVVALLALTAYGTTAHAGRTAVQARSTVNFAGLVFPAIQANRGNFVIGADRIFEFSGYRFQLANSLTFPFVQGRSFVFQNARLENSILILSFLYGEQIIALRSQMRFSGQISGNIFTGIINNNQPIIDSVVAH